MRVPQRLPFRIKLSVLIVLSCFAGQATALPNSPQVTHGNATFVGSGGAPNSALTVTNSAGTIINWNSFSIGSGESVTFNQPSTNSNVLNRVIGPSLSSLQGIMKSNGRVWLINPAGILVGPGARIDVAGFVASTLGVRDEDFLAGRLQFQGSPGTTSVHNDGTITTPSGGHIYLVGTTVENAGTLQAPGGATILATGDKVLIGDTSTPGIMVDLNNGGTINNTGQILAEAGRIGLFGALVKNSGLIDASSAVQQGGKVYLRASSNVEQSASGKVDVSGSSGGTVSLEAGDRALLDGAVAASGKAGDGGQVRILGDKVALLDHGSINAAGAANGGTVLVGGDLHGANPDVRNATYAYFGADSNIAADAGQQGNGGKVVVWSNDTTRAFGNISARGGQTGGDGGQVEVSGKQSLVFHATVDTGATAGNAGTLLLDPADITIGNAPTAGASSTATGSDTIFTGGSGSPGSPGTPGTTCPQIVTAPCTPIAGTPATAGTPGLSNISWGDINSLLAKNNVTITTEGSGAANGGRITLTSGNSYTANNALNLFAHGDINATGVAVTNSGTGAINATAGWSGQWQGAAGSSLPVNTTSNGVGSIVIQDSRIQTLGSMNWQAGKEIKILGVSSSNGTLVNAKGAQTITAPSVVVQAGDGSNGNGAGLFVNGNQTINTTNLLIRGGGDSGAFNSNLAGALALGSGATQTVNIAPGGSITITSGSGTGLTQFFSSTGSGCTNCVSGDSASLGSLGTQTINFATGGSVTPTLTLTGGLGGIGNNAGLTAVNGQTITGRPNIFLYGGTAGSSSTPSQGADLTNGATIANSSGNQSISAASLRLEGRGDVNTAGGATITAPVQTLDVSGDITLLGGASSETQRGSRSTINGNALTLNVGGNVTLTAGSRSGATIGSPAPGASTRATITGNVSTADSSGAIADFGWNDAIVTVNGNYTANGGPIAHQYNNNSAFNLLAGGNILLSGLQFQNNGTGAYNLTAGSTTSAPPLNKTLSASGSIVMQNSNVTTSGDMNWQASQEIRILGGNGSGLASTIEGGNQQFTAPSLTILGGDGGNDNLARLISHGNQTINTTQLVIQGGGSSGAFANNRAELGLRGGGVQKINIGAGGSVTITAGNGTGLTKYTNNAGTVVCNSCTSADGANLQSNGTQFINFATGSTVPTFTITGGTAGIGNLAVALAYNGQTITGQPIISLFGGTGGANTVLTESDNTQVPLWNLAGIVNIGSGPQQISASRITLTGLGDANTSGGAFIAGLQQSIIVGGNVKVQGGASNLTGAGITINGTPSGPSGGSAAAIFSNDLTLNVGGDLVLIGGTGSSSPAILGNPAGGKAQFNVAGNFTRSGNVLTTPSPNTSTNPTIPTPTTPTTTPTPSTTTATAATTNQVTADTVTRATETTPVTTSAAQPALSSTAGSLSVATAESTSSSAPATSIQQQDSKPAATGKPNMAALSTMIAQRHEQRTDLYQQALEVLRSNPSAADVPDCKAGGPGAGDVCVRTDTQTKLMLSAVSTVPATRKRVALLFGNNTYTDKRMAHLNTPIADVQSVAELLRTKFNFETHVVTNATKADFFREMNKLAGNVENADSVLVMYAGHGYEMKESKAGFWIPTDAKTDTPQNWISNKDIGRFLKAIPARQVVLVSDSCFSGTLTQEQKIREMKKQERTQILRQRSVTALSSGGDEPVLDSGAGGHSVFAGKLLSSLGQLKKDVTGFELYRRLHNAILQEFPQEPQYGGVLTAGHTGTGDYLLDVNTKPR